MVSDLEIFFLLIIMFLLYAGSDLFVAARISKSMVIQNYIKNLRAENIRMFIPTEKDILLIQKKLRLEYAGKQFKTFIIKKAITFACCPLLNENIKLRKKA